ncbi:MAG: GNAT family N-acetyltransferase [Planctomycetes bacterium]|nr:GNAT family N-acetyltransferase [Planctomycetota bacterium]
MPNYTFRQMTDEDVPEMTRVRNSVFSAHPLKPEDWNKDETCVLAFEDNKMVGAIPLDMREFLIAPGVSIRTAFENSVGVVDGMRGKGLGTKMIECAAEFLEPDCHALFVYRGGETSAAYRFYRKTGHVDLHFTRSFALSSPPSLSDGRIVLEEMDKCLEHESQLLKLFNESYPGMAGFRKREPGFWQVALDCHIFREMAYDDLLFATLRSGETIDAYALLGCYEEAAKIVIQEMAVAGGDAGLWEKLLWEVANVAKRRGSTVSLPTSDTAPCLPAALKLGFKPGPRGLIILARILRHKDVFDRIWQGDRSLADLKLTLWTPEFQFVALDGKPGGPDVTLEMKNETMTRLLLARADFQAALAEERITAYGADAALLAHIGRGFPFCKWIYHHLDNI